MDWRATTLIWIARLTGLGLVIYTIRPFAEFLEILVRYMRDPPQTMRAGGPTPWGVLNWLEFLIEQSFWALPLALGLNLLLGGRWLLRRMLRGLDGTCPACGHPWPDAGVRCPECGFGMIAPRERCRPARADARKDSDKVS